MFSIITTCKNRLSHLQQTLPLFTSHKDSEVIVVAYGCQEGTETWVKLNYPKVKLITVDGDPTWNASHARNLGAQEANFDNLIFLDADTLITPNFFSWLKKESMPGVGFVSKKNADLGGFLACEKRYFENAGKYDEAFIFWGGEDFEIKTRLVKHGLFFREIEPSLLQNIEHGDELRQFHTESSLNHRMMASIREKSYRQIKSDLTELLGKPLPLEQRKQLMRNINCSVEDMFSKQTNSTNLEINISPISTDNIKQNIHRKITYTIYNYY